MVVEVNADTCLHTELHSSVLSVSDSSEFDSAELDSAKHNHRFGFASFFAEMKSLMPPLLMVQLLSCIVLVEIHELLEGRRLLQETRRNCRTTRRKELTDERTRMIPQQWASPCGNQCTNKYAALTKIPWRVFCKKGCDADGDTWEECLEECNQMCYKDPVLKDQQWSAYIDRSPGSESYSEECFHACVSGCGYRFEIEQDKVDKVCPDRPPKPEPKPATSAKSKTA